MLSDSKLEVARSFGLIGHEKPGQPTPATLVLDGPRGVKLSTLNQGVKCLFARDLLDYTRAMKHDGEVSPMPAPQVTQPKPGRLFATALMNVAAGLMNR